MSKNRSARPAGGRARAARLEAERKAAEEAERRRRQRLVAWVVAGVVLLALVMAGVWAAVRGSADPKAVAQTDPFGVVQVSPGKPVVFTKPGATPKHSLTLWADARCSHCKQFEDMFGETIDKLVTSGDISLEINLAGFQGPPAESAARAFACAAQGGFGYRFYQSIWHSPAATWTDEQIISLSRAIVGKENDEFNRCVTHQKTKDYVASLTTEADRLQLTGTPTVYVDGREVDLAELKAPADLEARLR